MMVRAQALAEIAKLRGDALVVAVYSSAFEWLEISPHPLNFLAVGAMALIWRAVCEFDVTIFRISDDLAALRRAAEAEASSHQSIGTNR